MLAVRVFVVALTLALASAQADILALHNGYRRAHQVPPLTSSAALTSAAQSWANRLAASCTFEHARGTGQGENLASGHRSWTEVARGWYNEVRQYNYGAPGFGMSTGHFTQMQSFDQLDKTAAMLAVRVFVVALTLALASAQADILALHNGYRRAHQVPPLTSSAALTSAAQSWANRLAASCTFEHARGTGQGENLASGHRSWTEVARGWYNEVRQYNYGAPGFGMSTGHFTQMQSFDQRDKTAAMLAVRVFVVALTLALASAQADILALHNGYRRAHQVPPLTSSAALTSAAQSWANRLAASCTFEHARGTGQGENLASGHRSWTEVARGWYNEVRQYNYGAPGFGMSTGHFTQMQSFDQRDKTAAMLAVRVFVVALTLALASAQADILALHNGYRRAHQVPPLTSSAALTSAAQSWANRLAASCTFEHARGTGQGENLASGHRSWTEVARGWYNEVRQYNYGAPGFGMSTGHFTQMVFVVALTLALASAQADILALHNGYRRAHQVPPLTSSAALTSAAQSWANRLAASCTFEHARGTGQGENLASGHRSWTEVARGWYNEVRQYNYGAPGFGMSTGHFTQMQSFDQLDKTAAMLAVRVFVVALTLALASAQADILALHNGYRRAHQVPPLTSSAALTSAAQSWANRLAASCTFEHARGTGQGENLASGHRSWTEVARGWYNEVRQYNYGAPGFGMSTGHFTQMQSFDQLDKTAAMLAVRVFVVALTLALASAQADILALHNGYRRAHQVPPLTSSAALTSAAQSWANRLAASCTFEHARVTGQGENLASGHRSWTEVARGWYNEVRQYNYGAPGFGMSTGHFTQMQSFDQLDKTAAMLAVRVFVVALTLALASAQADILALHNGYRRAHQVPPLTSSAALTSAAQSWANRLAASCTFEHARGTGQGENLASGHRSWTEVARGWYNEVRQYNYGAPGFGMSTGHFTQM
ncbi:hypothetical protein QJQ45_014761, partial [Haematococcus lacustris]